MANLKRVYDLIIHLQDPELCPRSRHCVQVEAVEHQHELESRQPRQSGQQSGEDRETGGTWETSSVYSFHSAFHGEDRSEDGQDKMFGCCRAPAGPGSTDSDPRRLVMWASGRYRPRATSRGGCALRTASVRAGRTSPW